MIKRFCLCILSLLLLTIAPSASQNKPDEEREGGIVGTGIVGTITNLGSIFVNGQQVHFADDLIVKSDMGDRPATALEIGETVAVDALFDEGEWRAAHINHYLPIIGPVTTVSDSGVVILGSRVVVTPDTQVFGTGSAAMLEVGDWIAVNGLWRDNGVVASRIDRIAPQAQAIVVGSYRQNAEGQNMVGGTQFSPVELNHAISGDLLTVRGQPEDGHLRAETVATGLFTATVGTVLMEGYLSQPGPHGLYTIYGSGVIAYAGEEPMTVPTQRGLYCALTTPREPITRIAELPESRIDRNQVLTNLGTVDKDPCG